jgi:hypothetical protein
MTLQAFSYQWLRCEARGEACLEIREATSQSYTTTAADVGKTLRVRVTATYGTAALPPAVSAATAVVPGSGGPKPPPPPPPPPPSGGTHLMVVTAAGPVTTRLVFEDRRGSYRPTSARISLRAHSATWSGCARGPSPAARESR